MSATISIPVDRNVEAVLSCYRAFLRRDVPGIMKMLAPDVRITQTPLLPWGGEYTGYAGLATFLERLTTTVQSVVDLEETFAAGDRVVVKGRTRGQVRATGAAFDVSIVHIWTLREGKATAFEAYIDTPEMLAVLRAK